MHAELSVLMLPSQEALYRAHRHFRFTCTCTNKGTAVNMQPPQILPQQQQQQQQTLAAGQKPVQFWSLDALLSKQHAAVFGSSSVGLSTGLQPLDDDLGACAFLPLPYFLPPKPYERGDVPWTYSPHEGVDRYGTKLVRKAGC